MSSLDAATRAAVTESLAGVFAKELEGDALRDAVRDLGWQEIVDEDVSAQKLLFAAQGAALACSPLLDDVVLSAFGDELDGVRVPGLRVLYVLPDADDEPSGTSATGVLLAPADEAAEVIVLGSSGADPWAWLVPTQRVTASSATATFDHSNWTVASVDLSVARELSSSGTESAVAMARLALAAEINGVCTRALQLAIDHTTVRHQYGKPLASFQSVRHSLAEAHAAIEANAVTIDVAYEGDLAPDHRVLLARIAKLRAGDTQAIVLRRTVQVLGAMGLTLESDMHRYVTRAAALDHLLGSRAELAEELASAFLGGASIPRLVSLSH